MYFLQHQKLLRIFHKELKPKRIFYDHHRQQSVPRIIFSRVRSLPSTIIFFYCHVFFHDDYYRQTEVLHACLTYFFIAGHNFFCCYAIIIKKIKIFTSCELQCLSDMWVVAMQRFGVNYQVVACDDVRVIAGHDPIKEAFLRKQKS